ncbi:transposase [Stappia sp. GBMRC 2046]|uniref:Transposase n=1 Tax=Stappia sediminis TaxID=2692190 RepID=A0A7X3S6D2_9HYPH|nr:transposase [Stappia sediminis]
MITTPFTAISRDAAQIQCSQQSQSASSAPGRKTKYALRNHIERCFNRLKHSRRIATRYDKTAKSFLGFLCLTATSI